MGFILFDSVKNYSYFLPLDISRNMSSTAVLKLVKAFVQIKDNIERRRDKRKKERKKKADRNKRKLLFYPRMPWESCPGTNDLDERSEEDQEHPQEQTGRQWKIKTKIFS